jgi:hypothetical protein
MAVIPAKAGIHLSLLYQSNVDSRFRGNDGLEADHFTSLKGKGAAASSRYSMMISSASFRRL